MLLRPITVHGIAISILENQLPQAEALAARFSSIELATEVETVAGFVKFAAMENVEVAVAAFQHLHQKYCSANNIHVVVQQLKLSAEQAHTVLKGYYSVWDVLESRGMLPDVPRPALFAHAGVKLTAMFGGYGGMDNYLDEAVWLIDVYRPLLADYVGQMSAFLHEASQDPLFARACTQPVDFLSWVNSPESRPDMEYLSSAAVAVPLVALIQLMHLMVLYKTLRLSPGELSRSFKSVIGHSQGIGLATMLPTLTDEISFYQRSKKMLGTLIAGGSKIQLEVPLEVLTTDAFANCAPSDGKPSPMVSIRGIFHPELERLIAQFNSSHASPINQVHLALSNTFDIFVVTGRLNVVVQFVHFIRQYCATPGTDQSSIPFSQRKPVADISYVNSSIATHCILQQDTADWLRKFVLEKDWSYNCADTQAIPSVKVNGIDISSGVDLDEMVARVLCTEHFNWPKTLEGADATHIVDFSPGGFSGFARLARGIVDGSGVNVISCSSLLAHKNRLLGSKADLFQQDIRSVVRSMDWRQMFSSRLVRVKSTRQVHIDSPMFHALGMPPVMVSTMEPSVASVHLVAAAINAGYHAELSITGVANTGQLHKRVSDLVKLIEPGQGVTLSCDYSNQEQWSVLFPEILRIRRDGQPITGLSITGSILPQAVGSEIVSRIKGAGLRHITLKASTLEDIRSVIAISKVDCEFPVIMQWMGGRNGGYHSWDDFYQPILETYSLLRFHRNIVLVAGSGVGDMESAIKYVSGQWSVPFGRSPMPFDGVALGSRVLIAKESGLNDAAKQLIADTAGVAANEWTDSSSGVAGGVTSVVGENGQPMHVLATRAALLVKELQDTIFSLSTDEQAELIKAKRGYIIRRLNSDYVKPWFGKKADGLVVDIQDMTYSEVIRRMIELMYVEDKSRWIDPSLGRVVGDFIRRVEDRFCEDVREYIIRHQLELDENPSAVAHDIERAYPAVMDQRIATEDIQYFLMACTRPGQMSVPFVPILDNDLQSWMLKDAVLLSANSDCLLDNDAQRLLIPHGPASVKYSTTPNEHIKDTLDRIYRGMVQVAQKSHRTDVPNVEYVSAEPMRCPIDPVITEVFNNTGRTYTLPAEKAALPSTETWLEVLAGPKKSWLRALFISPTIFQNTKLMQNGVRRIMEPRAGQTVTIADQHGIPCKVEVFGSKGELDVMISFAQPNSITLRVIHSIRNECFDLVLKYVYNPSRPALPITEDMVDHGERVQRLYFGDRYGANAGGVDVAANGIGIPSVYKCEPYEVTADFVTQLCLSVGNMSANYDSQSVKLANAPMDMFFLIAWEGTLTMLSQRAWKSVMFDAVHLYNHTELVAGAEALNIGDVIDTEVRVTAIADSSMGKNMVISCKFSRSSEPLATMEIGMLFRGHEAEAGTAFKHVDGHLSRVLLKSAADIAILQSRQWVSPIDKAFDRLAPGATIEFDLSTLTRYANATLCSRVITTGRVYLLNMNDRRVHIANIDFDSTDAIGNPVLSYLEKNADVDRERHIFDNGGHIVLPGAGAATRFQAPTDCSNYSHISGDYNPLHNSQYIASYVGFPDTIIHGMWTSAATRAVVEKYVTGGDPERFRSFKTEFVSKVFPGDLLDVELKHVGMEGGLMLYEGKTVNQHGDTVMSFSAKIEQPKTAYIFTGQGAQFAGMGMDFYESSAVAQDVWKRADQYMVETYGVSLLKIVRENPTTYQVNFSGTSGEAIRNSYLKLVRRGVKGVTQLIPCINSDSEHYIHRSANGLLNSTLFTQPIQTVMSLAQVADMRAKGLVQSSAAFAGHSLGEIGSLAAITQIVSVEDAVELAFVRGLLLHASVERDNQGMSQYAMVSVNPSKVGGGFDERHLLQLVDIIYQRYGELLEAINYNVTDQQYVVTGHISSLAIMSHVIDKIATGQANTSDDIDKLIVKYGAEDAGDVHLKNGAATTVISGVDVPSHSTQLFESVETFRDLLSQKITAESCSYASLCGKYIPNMVGHPFEVSKKYFSAVYDVCKSPILASVLSNWNDAHLDASSTRNKLANTLLIELLAYQFACPVRWITTQQSLLSSYAAKQIVEVGPAPVLCKMIKQMCSEPIFTEELPAVFHVSQDHEQVYHTYTQEIFVQETPKQGIVQAPSIKATVDVAPPQSPAEERVITETPVVETATHHTSGVADIIPDKSLELVDVIRAVVAQKMNRSLVDIPLTRSLNEISAGKSIILNDIMGDMLKELAKQIPNKAEDMTIQQLADNLGSFHGMLGVHTRGLISKLFSAKLPNSFTQAAARDHLGQAYGLQKQRQDGLLLLAITMEPSSRLADEVAAKEWVRTVADVYAKKEGITYTASAGSTNASGSTGAVAVINSAEFEEAQNSQQVLAMRQIQALAQHLNLDMRKGEHMHEAAMAELDICKRELSDVKNELGDELTKGTSPRCDRRKSRHYNSYWNWVRQDALEWINDMLLDGSPKHDSVKVAKISHMFVNRSHPALIEMLSGFKSILANVDDTKSTNADCAVSEVLQLCIAKGDLNPVYRMITEHLRPRTVIAATGDVQYVEEPRPEEQSSAEFLKNLQTPCAGEFPPIMMRERSQQWTWAYSAERTKIYFDALGKIAESGLSFAGKSALITGCSNGSLAQGLLEGLLTGGANVIVTTSHFSLKVTRFYEDIYRRFGARGSQLVVVPFNQGSAQDVASLIDYIYSPDGLGWNLDYVLPFAAIPEHARDVTNISSESELAFRIMLTNVIRMIGEVKTAREKYQNGSSPALVILPNSPNKGVMGDDGLYSAAKMALLSIYDRWHAESWSNHVSVAGIDIGWVRGTNFTGPAQIVYEGLEKSGLRTYSRDEMAFCIFGLMSPTLLKLANQGPIDGNFTGGVLSFSETRPIYFSSRNQVLAESERRKAIYAENLAETITYRGDESAFFHVDSTNPLANHNYEYPTVKSYEQLEHLRHLEGMVNLDKVVVVTGFGEVGPFGNSKMRWEMEAFGEFSLEGCVELAWIMGLIKHHNGHHSMTRNHYVGWVDAKTEEPVQDMDIKARYEPYILDHTGIRFIEPELHDGYDPNKKGMMRELQIDHDLEPFEASAEEAANFKRGNGDKVDIWENSDSSWSVKFLKGAVLLVPKALRFDRSVAAQIPTGWDPAHFGIPQEIIEVADPTTCYVLVAAMEALIRSGITDPYELYQYFHVSQVGHSIGSSSNGAKSTLDVVRHRWMDKNMHTGLLVTMMINTASAYVNTLLMSAAGPNISPVGACVTSFLSLDVGVNTIMSGKAKVMVCGAFDSYSSDTAYEFGQLGATSNSDIELINGRDPKDMCRPCTDTRSGYMEGYGAGMFVIMSASAAIEIGAPIYGIASQLAISTDKQSSNLGAPGQGLLTIARQTIGNDHFLLDIGYRRKELYEQLESIELTKKRKLVSISNTDREPYSIKKAKIESAASRARAASKDMWGNDFWKNTPEISPLLGGLATWGLTADDISMVSFHGTSTPLNDINESDIVDRQLSYIGRTPGYPAPVTCQKSLTGHSKAVSGAWQLNEVLQAMGTGIIPGNKSADNIDPSFDKFTNLVYPSKSIKVPQIKSALITSFGLGQAGAEALIIHPDYLFATLSSQELGEYRVKVARRQQKSYRYHQDALAGKHSFVQLKDAPPFTLEQEASVYMNPLARASYDPVSNSYHF